MIGSKIKALRQSAGMTQQELGDKLGVQKSAVAKYENGRVNPPVPALEKMCGIFDVKMCDFFYRDDDQEYLIEMVRHMDDSKVSRVLAFAEFLEKNGE